MTSGIGQAPAAERRDNRSDVVLIAYIAQANETFFRVAVPGISIEEPVLRFPLTPASLRFLALSFFVRARRATRTAFVSF